MIFIALIFKHPVLLPEDYYNFAHDLFFPENANIVPQLKRTSVLPSECPECCRLFSLNVMFSLCILNSQFFSQRSCVVLFALMLIFKCDFKPEIQK